MLQQKDWPLAVLSYEFQINMLAVIIQGEEKCHKPLPNEQAPLALLTEL